MHVSLIYAYTYTISAVRYIVFTPRYGWSETINVFLFFPVTWYAGTIILVRRFSFASPKWRVFRNWRDKFVKKKLYIPRRYFNYLLNTQFFSSYTIDYSKWNATVAKPFLLFFVVRTRSCECFTWKA